MRRPALQGGSVPKTMLDNETHFKLLRHIEQHPQATQRELAEALGVSLGKANYCLKALMEKGLVKARNFKNSHNKRAYLYILTPLGIETKARITARFLQRKLAEYETLQSEIEQLRKEVGATPSLVGATPGRDKRKQ